MLVHNLCWIPNEIMSEAQYNPVPSLWNDQIAKTKNQVDLLLYRSNILGEDTRVTNYGGGNTSAKLWCEDPLTGEQVQVLWVKGSGGDLRTLSLKNTASLYLDRVLALETKYKAGLHEDQIVPLYSHCTFNLNPVASSIDTPLHAFIPHAHIDHVHPDSVIALAASADSIQLTQDAFEGDLGYVPWKRPGFELGLMMRDGYAANPSIHGFLMGGHGLIVWADDPRECYERTIAAINKAGRFIASRTKSVHAFGNVVSSTSSGPARTWESLLPTLRGKVAFNGTRLIADIVQTSEALDFLSRSEMPRLSGVGTSCPDHFLRTKIAPMVVPDPTSADFDAQLETALGAYRSRYQAYYDRCKKPDSPAIRNPNPSVMLIPGMGIVSFGKNKTEAKITSEFYQRAIEVMRGAETVSKYVALPEQEAFDIEYWLLEEAKLKRQPPEVELSRQIAVVTGAAQGIGRATALRLSELGACVALFDINEEKLSEAVSEVVSSGETAIGVRCDVTDTASLESAFGATIREFGGIDIVVVSAGNARRGSALEATDADYDFLSNLLMKAYLTTIRSAANTMVQQGTGGSIVVIASKNGVATGSNAAVYSAAKAFELHLMRTVANDLAKHSIRCNAVNPDAVLQGSGIWSDQWKTETARMLGIAPDELFDYYRKRTLLGVSVLPEHIAEAVAYLASEKRSSRTTGAVIPVDGGVREGFLR